MFVDSLLGVSSGKSPMAGSSRPRECKSISKALQAKDGADAARVFCGT